MSEQRRHESAAEYQHRTEREAEARLEARLAAAAPRFQATHFDVDSHLRRVLEVVRRVKGK